MTTLALEDVLDRYEGVLLDLYGVLVGEAGVLPGAAALVERLAREGRPSLVVTNDASRLPAPTARRLAERGIAVPPDRILTSGMLLEGYYREHGLAGARTIVLGPDDARRYVERAGGRPVPPSDEDVEVLVVADERGYPFLETVGAVLSTLYRRLDAGGAPRLVLPNPDLVFPTGDGGFGLTSGAIALVLEAALERRYPEAPPRFDRLGKPFPPLFREAMRRLGTDRLLMIGDQLETDVAGAAAVGIDSLLVTTGVSRPPAVWSAAPIRPTYVARSLAAGIVERIA